jgi:hypothetical protein
MRSSTSRATNKEVWEAYILCRKRPGLSAPDANLVVRYDDLQST